MSSTHGPSEGSEGVSFSPGKGELERAVLTHASGSCCEVYLQGAHVTRWRAPLGRELLFLSERAEFRTGKAIRGGIPVIFPQFSGQGPLPAHGFARNANWKVEGTHHLAGGDVSLTLSLASNDQTRDIWKHDFQLTLTVTLNERLSLRLQTANTGGEPFCFQNAFHTYFRITDIASTAILGLRGTQFIDFLQEGKVGLEARESVRIEGATDRVYSNAADLLRIVDLSGTGFCAIQKTGMKDAVVWNPWKEKCAALKDMEPSEYTRMLCVESGNINETVTLAAGEISVSTMELTESR